MSRKASACRWTAALLVVAAGLTVPVARARPSAAVSQAPAEALYAWRTPNLFYHNAGLLEMMVTNMGLVGSLNSSRASAVWYDGEYLFGAALWIGAIAPDNLEYVSTGYAWSAEGEFELLPGIEPTETIYQSFEGVTGGERPGFSARGGDDDQDGLIDEDFHNGHDDDDDGQIDEDYQAISQQMYSCEYTDYADTAIRAYPRHRPLNLRIRQRSFAWSSEGINEFVGFDYVITNEGFEDLRQVYIGYFVDSDVGRKSGQDYHVDDQGGYRSIDTTYVNLRSPYLCTDPNGDQRNCSKIDLHLDVAYMFDTPGNVAGGNAADDLDPATNGYFGGMFLGHTTDPFGERAPRRVQIHTCHFFSGAGSYPDGDPLTDAERYDLLSLGTKPRRPASRPADYRFCFSAGPFRDLLPGETLRFQVAFAVGAGWDGLLKNAIEAQRVYNGEWRDVDGLGDTGCWGQETCLHVVDPSEPVFWRNPCDSLSPAVGPIKNQGCDRATHWVDDDCNCCTPLQLGPGTCQGWEELVHWVGRVSPPPPAMSTDDPVSRTRMEDDRSVRLEWDNASELVADPSTGQVLFCGYRVWRVENWKRPFGSVGPAPQEWHRLADLTPTPRGSQLDLDDYTNPFAAATDSVPMPGGRLQAHYAVGRYFYVDTMGLKNGMLYFYDVTPYSCWYEGGEYMELTTQPAALEAEGVRPSWSAVTGDDWRSRVIIVPNPWHGGADWDLTPSDADPTGTHIDFAFLPDRECTIRIYSLSGDLVQTLDHDGRTGRGTARWNLLSRRGQDVASGIYLYTITCGDETKVGRFTVIR
jgi:hypothetical protein